MVGLAIAFAYSSLDVEFANKRIDQKREMQGVASFLIILINLNGRGDVEKRHN